EPAAKGLREIVYLDDRIVKRSRDFVCVMLTPTSSSTDYAELTALGIGGKIISPQHIFVSSAGDKVLLRKEYWSHGSGDKAVEKLLSMMDEAEKRAAAEPETPEGGPEAGPVGDAPADGEARAAWIASQMADLEKSEADRDRALAALVKNDRDGDCTGPLIELLPKLKKKTDLLWCVIYALGVNGLEAAAEPLTDFLGHKDVRIRACAAVSLEYIGSGEKKVLSALMKAAGKQKDESVANHICRAVGRCGAKAKEGKARSLLLKMAAAGRSEYGTYGPIIGLAYFEGDEKAMRGVEKLLKAIGLPGGRRGGGQNTIKRVLLAWTLAHIGDDKSARFVHAELIDKMKNMQAFWVRPLQTYYENVAKQCNGEGDQMGEIVGGVQRTVGFAKRWTNEERVLMDDARTGRDNSKFTPKGDNILGGARDD
ncbi:MAG: HEAT repeat domain-containing protein, partial [Planctomycetota bacterium]